MKRARLALFVVASVASAVGVACVLADPPPIASTPPATQPFILTDAVSPPEGQKIVAPPSDVPLVFSVPVVVDVDSPIEYRVFLDLDPTSTSQPTKLIDVSVTDGGVVGLTPDADSEATRVLSFQFTSSSPIDFSTCHRFTFIVAASFIDGEPSRPAPPGGDQITWYYEPIENCAYYDAGPPTYVEAGSDGADE